MIVENRESLTWNAGYAIGRMVGSSPLLIYPYQPQTIGHGSLAQPERATTALPTPAAIRPRQGSSRADPTLPQSLQVIFDEEFAANKVALQYLADS